MAYPTIAPATPTVLQRITTRFEERIDGMLNEDLTRLWNAVVRGELIMNNALSVPAIGIHQGPEQTYLELWPHIEKVVTFYLEFRFERNLNIDSLVAFQYYLGKLQARLFGVPDNVRLGGLTTNVLETNSNPQIDGESDPMPGGLLIFQAHYRHHNGDPYHLPSETPNYAFGQP